MPLCLEYYDMTIALAEVPRRLMERTGRPAPPGAYRKLWGAVVSAQLPAERVGGGWRLRDEDLPAAAAILGMAADGATGAAS